MGKVKVDAWQFYGGEVSVWVQKRKDAIQITRKVYQLRKEDLGESCE